MPVGTKRTRGDSAYATSDDEREGLELRNARLLIAHGETPEFVLGLYPRLRELRLCAVCFEPRYRKNVTCARRACINTRMNTTAATAAVRGRPQSAEHLQRRTQAVRRAMTPEVRRRIGDGIRAAWARKRAARAARSPAS